ncbi:hypothetical protein HHK36_019830 [Tetracentron sinense]|uniref:Uncharacterized protein n=1 Tax=Tetracentron sinense TaxID=13715 RepID=A0A834YY13_TETSI|nr:hypothetical protein HHK36_019830 [Tetracentron sinense]
MEDDHDLSYGAAPAAPALVSLTPFSPSISHSLRRLSTHFSQPSRPIRAARRLAWVSLQGRLIDAEEASSARNIGGGLTQEEAVAWELFSPIHRILIVAVVAAAAADSKKSRQIWKLRKSVDLRDQVLLSMEQKLDDLCEQVNSMKDRSEIWPDMSFITAEEFPFGEAIKPKETKFCGCGCRLCAQHLVPSNSLVGDSVEDASGGDEMFKYKMTLTNGAEQEERRMSDLSDWASSVTSAADIQLNALAIEQDMYNLKRECEEKDATIKELSTIAHTSDAACSERIAELEDIIRRKTMVITKLKKDMVVLEQKVVQLTRLRRSSASTPIIKELQQLPVMADNLIYDMDSTTSPSSSDSDCTTKNRSGGSVTPKSQAISAHQDDIVKRRNQISALENAPISLTRSTEHPTLQPLSPFKENSMNHIFNSVRNTRPKQLVSAGGDLKRNRRRVQSGSKDIDPQKRWV